MSIFTVTFFTLHLAFCCFTGEGADVTLECPRKWRHQCTATMSSTLQTTNFNRAVCTVFFNKTIEFKFQKKSSPVVSTECAVDFNTSCDGSVNNQGCACVSLVGTLYTFQYNLVISDSLNAYGSWSCEPQCLNRSILLPLSTSWGDTCSFVQISYFILAWRGIVLLCVGSALVFVGVVMRIADCLGVAGKVGIALDGVGYVLLIAGGALMTVAYIDDEPAGIAFLWVGSVLLIVLGTGISIIGPCLHRDFGVRAKVGTGLMWVGGTLAIIGGIVATTERCPSDEFPTTLQEILGLVFAVIGFVVFVVGIIIGIVGLQEE